MNSVTLPHSSVTDLTPSNVERRGKLAVVSRHTARLLMGVPLVVFGLNGFFNFIPPPSAPLPETAMSFLTALVSSGYMMPLITITLLVSGLLLVANRFVPVALLFMAPFLVNSVLFHAFLEPSGRGPAIVFAVLELFLLWSYRSKFRPLLSAR